MIKAVFFVVNRDHLDKKIIYVKKLEQDIEQSEKHLLDNVPQLDSDQKNFNEVAEKIIDNFLH